MQPQHGHSVTSRPIKLSEFRHFYGALAEKQKAYREGE